MTTQTDGFGSLVWHYVEKWAKDTPDGEAMIYRDQRTTYREFGERMDKLARGLIEMGVAPGDRVMMMTPARCEFMEVYMAALRVGAMWVGLNPKFTIDEFRYMAGDAKPMALVIVREFMGRDYADDFRAILDEFNFIKGCLVIGGETFGDRTDDYEAFLNKARPEADAAMAERAEQTQSDDGALIVYTSGTTGKPKGAVLTHRNIVSNIGAEVEHFDMRPGRRILLHFPVNHVAGATEISIAALMGGGCAVLMDHFHPVESLKTIEREKVDIVGQIPTMFLLQMAQPEFKTVDLSGVKLWIWAGAAAPEPLIKALMAMPGEVMTGYGMTELTGFVTYTRRGASFEELAGTAGKCDEHFEMKIVDENRNDLPAGEVGEVAMRGDAVLKEYFNRPEATAAARDVDGWFYTGDVGSLDADGNLKLSGRRSEMYKSGGENVYPREIEAVLEDCPQVAMAAVIGVPDEVFQEVGKAFVMPKPGAEISEDKLRAVCKEKLANYKVPKTFVIRPMLPMLPNGKIDKKQLKAEK